ncbi:MAG: adenylate/guanylate cyclase domain-containing protein [Dermatophilus congolensis]|nr:adenylate/guanylate cyclase domain-containing protein [Dermatophilus congolensis]
MSAGRSSERPPDPARDRIDGTEVRDRLDVTELEVAGLDVSELNGTAVDGAGGGDDGGGRDRGDAAPDLPEDLGRDDARSDDLASDDLGTLDGRKFVRAVKHVHPARPVYPIQEVQHRHHTACVAARARDAAARDGDEACCEHAPSTANAERTERGVTVEHSGHFEQLEQDENGADYVTLRSAILSRLLGSEHRVRRREVAREAHLPFLTARRIWHALGFPGLGGSDMAFTDADLGVVSSIADLRQAPFVEDELVLELARSLARSTDRLADWHTSLLMEAIGRQRDCDGEDPDEVWSKRLSDAERAQVVRMMLDVADQLEPMLVYAWRRHLASSLGQLLNDDQGVSPEATDERSVGFADLVGFTSVVSRLSERRVSALVGEFEALASDVVTAHGGRIVKTIGDEVLFVTPRAASAAAIGLDLVDALRMSKGMPALRVGLATGSVVAQFGDVFGTTVNRASRLTSAAQPGMVVLDNATQSSLATVSGFETRSLEPRPLRGLGVTSLWELRRTTGPERRGPVTIRAKAARPPGVPDLRDCIDDLE